MYSIKLLVNMREYVLSNVYVIIYVFIMFLSYKIIFCQYVFYI